MILSSSGTPACPSCSIPLQVLQQGCTQRDEHSWVTLRAGGCGMGCAEPQSLHRPSPGKEEGPGPGQWAVALTHSVPGRFLSPLELEAARTGEAQCSQPGLRQELLGGWSNRPPPTLRAMAKVEWLLAPWQRAGKAGGRAGLRRAVGAVGSAGTAHSTGQDPRLGAPPGHRASGCHAIVPGVSAAQQYQSCATFPRLT